MENSQNNLFITDSHMTGWGVWGERSTPGVDYVRTFEEHAEPGISPQSGQTSST